MGSEVCFRAPEVNPYWTARIDYVSMIGSRYLQPETLGCTWKRRTFGEMQFYFEGKALRGRYV